MLERFSIPARMAVARARQEAKDLGHHQIGGEHLLLAMLADKSSGACRVLNQAGVDHDKVRADAQRSLGTPNRILNEEDAAALRTLGIDLDTVLSRIEQSFGPDALLPPAPARRRLLRRRSSTGSRFSPRARKVLELALREAVRLGSKSIGTEHLLLGILRDGGGAAAALLMDAGLTLTDLREATINQLGKAA